MKKTTNYKQESLNVLKELSKKYPTQLLSTHISMALSEYGNFDGVSDKELYFIFEKYRCEKELDMQIPHDEDIAKIIEDGQNLNIEDIYEDSEEEF